MRTKQTKKSKKAMLLYRNNFGFREPYQVIIAPDFVLAGVAVKIDIKAAIERVLQGPVNYFITYCGICDLRKDEKHKDEAIAVSKTFEKRHCSHKEPVAGINCIEELLNGENKNNYCIAVQSEELRSKLRNIPGVPILHVRRTLIILENTSQATKDKQEAIVQGKLAVSTAEKKLLQDVKKAEISQKQALRKNVPRKKKGPKGPNPLSVKKKKQQPSSQPAKSNNEEQPKKKEKETLSTGTKRPHSDDQSNETDAPKSKRKNKNKSVDNS
ncbi:hypothetical protein IW150_001975 [Coemansia sp. RSA 2607]|nr:hypothetical protein IW150_001975 [Coemansia sp. RSA 2607]KAJ2397526.1 hypothetical protein GGI05_000597 [Coemansia sp. RSA 2603]